MNGWIGVDLDRTLAHYDVWHGRTHIGEPIPAMVERVKRWLAEGRDVRIFTARIADGDPFVRDAIEGWTERHIGVKLPVTATKDFEMVELWDDRAVQVIPNTGIPVEARCVGICEGPLRAGTAGHTKPSASDTSPR